MTDRVIDLGPEVFARMQSKDPVKRYKKTILGKVFVLYIDPFNGEFKGATLRGNPELNEDSCFINVWSEKEMLFFENQNAPHFQEGRLVEVKIEKEVVRTPDQYTDEELSKILDEHYFTLQTVLNKLTSISRIARLLELAQEKEKSAKVISRIEARLSELQIKEVED